MTVTLSEDPERTVTIPIDQDGPGRCVERGLLGGPGQRHLQHRGDTSKSFTFTATADTVDDDGESVKLTFDTDNLPTGVTEGTTSESVVSINDDDLPVGRGRGVRAVVLHGGRGQHPVTVNVILSEDPEQTVTIGISKADQGGASSADYSGVPSSVTFNSGDTEKSFTFSATADSIDDDGESVKLTFTNLPTGVTEGTTKETVISITDDDVPSVTVEYGSATYSVEESDDASTTETKENEVTVTVKLSADPERTVTIPIEKTDQDGASSADYSGVPASVTFNAGDTEKSFTFTATADTVDDDGESVKLTFGSDNLPDRGDRRDDEARASSPSTTTTCPSDVDVEYEQSSYTVAEGSTQ